MLNNSRIFFSGLSEYAVDGDGISKYLSQSGPGAWILIDLGMQYYLKDMKFRFNPWQYGAAKVQRGSNSY